MKKRFFTTLFFVTLLIALVSFGLGGPLNKPAKTGPLNKGFAVVELFTSEGCSSCPPADAAVEALAKDYPTNVFVLGFHVDYWNYLGWKDEYSSAAYSTRQQAYAAAFSLNSIYTPQVIVNGGVQFTGSEKSRLYSTVKNELMNTSPVAIELAAKAGVDKELQVNYSAAPGNKSDLCIVLVQLQASSAVKRGENRGMQLHHINVVRDFKTISGNKGSVSLHLPAGLDAKDCKVLAFTQQKSDMHITGAAICSIQ